MKFSIIQAVMAGALVVLAADALYERFFNRMPDVVYVRGGDLSVTVDGGQLDSIDQVGSVGSIDFTGTTLDVNVAGGKLDYPTDWSGRLIVKPE